MSIIRTYIPFSHSLGAIKSEFLVRDAKAMKGEDKGQANTIARTGSATLPTRANFH